MTERAQAQQQAQRIVQNHAWGQAIWHVWSAGQNKPRLVLLHGGSGSWTHWVRNVLHLAKRHEVWALDIPGFGDSDLPPNACDADDLVPHVEEIFQQAFADDALTLMGFSFGGMLAGLIAAQYMHRVRKLILIGVPGLGLFGRALPMRGMREDMSDAEQREVHRHNLRVMMLSARATIDDDLLNMQQANVARDRLRRRRIARTDVLARAQTKWQCEVHGIWGEQDALYADTLTQVPQVLHRLQSFHCIPGAGHWVQYEASEAFHACIEALI